MYFLALQSLTTPFVHLYNSQKAVQKPVQIHFSKKVYIIDLRVKIHKTLLYK